MLLPGDRCADRIYWATGAKASESIRRAINLYLEQKKAEVKEGKKK
jgi:hypothetical protein